MILIIVAPSSPLGILTFSDEEAEEETKKTIAIEEGVAETKSIDDSESVQELMQ